VLSIGILAVSMPSIGSYAISKVTGYDVNISKIDYEYTEGVFAVSLKDLSLKGKAEGHIKKWLFSIGIKEGFHIKNVTISDFDLKISDIKGKKGFVPIFAEFLDIKNGRFVYGKHTFFIHEIKVNNFKLGQPFTFELVVDNDSWLKNLKASGEGAYALMNGVPDLKGQIYVTQLNLNKISESLKGKANVKGAFTYTKKVFSLNGPFEIFDYEEKGKSFKNVLSVEKTKGDVLLTYSDNAVDIKMSHMLFKGTPINLDLMFEKNSLARLELDSGYIDLQDIKHYIALGSFSKTPIDIWDYVRGGKIKIEKFIFSKDDKLNADLEMEDGEIFYKNLLFQKVGGKIIFDNKKLNMSNFRGTYKSSMFSNVAGVIPFSSEKDINIKGNYAFNLKDVPSLLDLGDLSFRKGKTDGAIELGGNKKRGYILSGTGKLNDADGTWRKVSAKAKGSYTFSNDEIAFDPLTLSRGSSDITIRGKWKKNFMDLKIKGSLNVLHVKPFLAHLVPDMNGTTDIDISVQQKDKWFKLCGDIIMDDLYFDFPGIVKKKSGIQSKANLTITKVDENISLEELLYNIDVFNLALKGNLDKKNVNFDVSVDVTDVERVASVFFFDSDTTKGNIELRAKVRDLTIPVYKLPYIIGYAKVNEGVFRLPWMQKTLEKISFTSFFRGETFDIKLDSLKFGSSLLNRGELHIDGLESPRFSLYIDIDTFEYDDMQSNRTFEIPVILKDSLPAKASGDISLHAKKIKKGKVTGENLDITGIFNDRKLIISELKMDYLEGRLNSHGSIDFSDPHPHIRAEGKFKNFESGLFLDLFGEKSHIIEGKSTISGSIDSSGKSTKDLIGSMKGEAAIFSRDGLIKRWNILSKIFGLQNIKDIFRKNSSFAKDGLYYKRMGATFKIKNGIFNTNDFLIDSPSMLITGNGNMNAKDNEIDGVLTLSPLVAVDRTIDRIPILGRILKKKDKGILSLSFTIKGQADDPAISLNFTNSVGGKTIELLKNILVLPKGMIE
jgi:hypothetical protein